MMGYLLESAALRCRNGRYPSDMPYVETRTKRGLIENSGRQNCQIVKLSAVDEETGPAAYRIHVWIRRINPMIWRRLVVFSESTLADPHYVIQSAFAWTDYHLHRKCCNFENSDGGCPRGTGRRGLRPL